MVSASIRSSSRASGGWHGNIHAAAFAVEEHLAINQCKKRVVAAHADANARMHLGAALADDDVAGDDRLTAKFFHAEAFAAGIATVFDGALSFFMGHGRRGV